MSVIPGERHDWQHGKVLIALEFLLIGLIYFADWKHRIFLSKVPYLLALAWISLRVRGLRWRDVGFRVYPSWGRAIAIGIVAGAGIELLELFGTQPLLVRITGVMPDLSAFDRVAGNVVWLAVSLALTWTVFAVGEEMIFRGYLMNRVAPLLGSGVGGWATTLVVVSFVFGLSHFAQGITGVSENFIDGMILGALYLGFGRSLAVPIVAHGVTDSVDFLLLFFHKYPGIH